MLPPKLCKTEQHFVIGFVTWQGSRTTPLLADPINMGSGCQLGMGWLPVSGCAEVVMVGSSINERDQMLFISTDEGSSFQRQAVDFTPETVIFHPKEEDKLLAYCKDGRLFASTDLGRKWTLLQERVTKDRIFWSVSGVDLDPDLVHMEMQDSSGGYLYVTCLIQNCSDKMVTAQFLGKIDHNSLLVQDDYIFVKVTTGNRTKHYVSYRRNEFVQMRFPKYALPKG
ncbi:VPS10 domain-containing receptor SorCS2 [Crenichthys baileyi]|uniref:VPS10 domain-containing receptor SorCS2 n=1 Tax=Crenichthys baileyi TaxID=28760 RepID=A0AAV9QXW3_9TELE